MNFPCKGCGFFLSLFNLLKNKFSCAECGKNYKAVSQKSWGASIFILIASLPITMSSADFIVRSVLRTPGYLDARFLLFIFNVAELVLVFPVLFKYFSRKEI